MAVTVPPIPYKSPLLQSNGYLTDPWAKWFREVFSRIGGVTALSNTELETLQSGDLEDIQADVTSLQSDVSSLQSLTTTHTSDIASIQTSIDGLNQGPVL